jgi:3-phosphoinositide dependent protein kinase-1
MLPISYSKSSPKILNGGEEIKEEKEIKLNKVKDIQTSNLSTMSPTSSPTKKSSIKDFLILKDLGRGAYGKVTLAKYVTNHKKIAIKILDKKFMNKHNKSHEALIEREILSNCDHPNIIKLISTFHDKDKLYYVLEYAPNKDLANFIRSQGVLSLDLGKFYAAEIVNAIEYLHNKNIAHRDLKPENMVLDQNMHIKLVQNLK